jgi:hypothetical protein
MEKRVRSRLAQQPLFIDICVYLKTCDDYVQLIKRVLTIDGKSEHVKRWNIAIEVYRSIISCYNCCYRKHSQTLMYMHVVTCRTVDQQVPMNCNVSWLKQQHCLFIYLFYITENMHSTNN